MSDYLIYLNKKLVTTISLSTFPAAKGRQLPPGTPSSFSAVTMSAPFWCGD